MRKNYLLLLFLAIIIFSVYAENDKELLFMNVPYLCSSSQVRHDLGSLLKTSFFKDYISEYSCYDFRDRQRYRTPGLCVRSFGSTNVEIASHKISDAIYYCYIDLKDDPSGANVDFSRFYRVDIRFNDINQGAIYSDLLTKLTTLYGSPIINLDAQGRRDEETGDYDLEWEQVWEGSKNTAIRLYRNSYRVKKYSKFGDSVTLSYGLLNSDSLLEEQEKIFKEIKKNEEEKKKVNYYGL